MTNNDAQYHYIASKNYLWLVNFLSSLSYWQVWHKVNLRQFYGFAFTAAQRL